MLKVPGEILGPRIETCLDTDAERCALSETLAYYFIDKPLIEITEETFPKKIIGKEVEVGNENNKLQSVDANTRTEY